MKRWKWNSIFTWVVLQSCAPSLPLPLSPLCMLSSRPAGIDSLPPPLQPDSDTTGMSANWEPHSDTEKDIISAYARTTLSHTAQGKFAGWFLKLQRGFRRAEDSEEDQNKVTNVRSSKERDVGVCGFTARDRMGMMFVHLVKDAHRSLLCISYIMCVYVCMCVLYVL